MGVKSTYQISRETAKEVLMSSILRCTNEELEEMLEALPQSEYRNYLVFDNTLEWTNKKTINSPEEFFITQ